MALRQRELAIPRRPFLARGSKVVRCQTCLMPLKACICAVRPVPLHGSAFCFILYWGEAFKPTNTGRLVADVIHDNHAFLWDRTRPDPALLALLTDPRYEPVLVFPTQYAEPERCIESPAELPGIAAGKTPLYVMLDGTWREAKKMFRSAYLAPLPVLGLNPEAGSRYQLREAVDKASSTLADLKQRSPDKIEDYITDEAVRNRLGLAPTVEGIARNLTKIRQSITQITNSQMPADEKASQIRNLREAEREMLKGVNLKEMREFAKI